MPKRQAMKSLIAATVFVLAGAGAVVTAEAGPRPHLPLAGPAAPAAGDAQASLHKVHRRFRGGRRYGRRRGSRFGHRRRGFRKFYRFGPRRAFRGRRFLHRRHHPFGRHFYFR
ncbi:MAG: hypothetical protein ACR2PI_11490 [Hyphomicrobiaceae bacterium]